MTEKELIPKIEKLKEIKPREEWVLLAKERMFEQEMAEEQVLTINWGDRFKEVFEHAFLTLKYKPVMATVTSFALLLAVVVSAQNSLPGDNLYAVKKITEQVRVKLASKTEQPKIHLSLTEKRLTELAMIADANLGRNLAPAIEEFEKTAKETAQSINEMPAGDYKEIVASVQAIEAKTKTIEETLAVKIDNNALEQSADAYYKTEVEQQIADLEGRTLNPEQEEFLTEAKKYYETGDYSQALEKIYLLGNSER